MTKVIGGNDPSYLFCLYGVIVLIRGGSRVYVLEDGAKVKAVGKGRLKITIRKGFELKRIHEIREAILVEVIKIDTRVHTYGEVILIGIFAAMFFLVGYQLR